MKTYIRIASFAIVLFLNSYISFGQMYSSGLTVLDPKSGWWTAKTGNIDDVNIVVEPKGIYANIQLYITFSANKLDFVATDTLEIQYGFYLPETAIVNDSWLLINGSWEKALILDKWTANSIYEGIVKRRRDPSILSKDYSNHYSLNVFPMAAHQSRTVMISYMVPFTYTTSSASLSLPFSILQAAINPVKNIKVYVKESMGYKNPAFPNISGSVFSKNTNNLYNGDKLYTVANETLDGTLTFETPLKDGIYAAKYQIGNEGIYQIAFVPSMVFDIKTSKKLLVLVNYISGGSASITKADIVDGIKNMLHNVLNPVDSFNIVFSGLKIKTLSNTWIGSDSVSMKNAFANFTTATLTGTGELGALISTGLENIKNVDSGVSVLLISNSSEYANATISNNLLAQIKQLFPKLPQINIFDYSANCNNGFNGNGVYYCGNGYLYGLLSRQTGGTFIQMNNGEAFKTKITDMGQSLSTILPTFDYITSLEKGFCYGRQTVGVKGTTAFLDKPYITIGKFNGTFPIVLQLSGIYNNEAFSTSISITADEAETADYSANTIWAGNFIKELEGNSNLRNDQIAEIINFSLENRVLSLYTSFLTLEPGLDIEPCETCSTKNDNQVVSVIKNIDNTQVDVYPNPFVSNVKIKLSALALTEKTVEVRIFNAMGQLIKQTKENVTNGEAEFIWNGKLNNGTDAPVGNYIISITSGTFSKTVKILKTK